MNPAAREWGERRASPNAALGLAEGETEAAVMDRKPEPAFIDIRELHAALPSAALHANLAWVSVALRLAFTLGPDLG